MDLTGVRAAMAEGAAEDAEWTDFCGTGRLDGESGGVATAANGSHESCQSDAERAAIGSCQVMGGSGAGAADKAA